MSPSPQLAPPGSSTYDSNTMHVGDGTWDAGRETFLLPNLVGLNFDTMRYNGMGNRFYAMDNYHNLIRAHGIIAAIIFLGLIPLAIFMMRFYGRKPRWALRIHIWLQILTLFLSTAVIILGFIAVGPRRSLSNPHHGIGVAIYVMIWAQIIGGWLVHRGEKNKRRFHLPLKAMLHHWLGRAIALLGIAQIALGLTLYGSPLFLFVLYALVVFAFLVMYFILEWLAERRKGEYSDAGSYYTDEVIQERRSKHGGVGKLAAAGAAGAGLAALFRRRSSRNRPTATYAQGTETGTSLSEETWEKDSEVQPPRRSGGFMQKILPIAAVGGGVAAARKLFGGRGNTTSGRPSRPPPGGAQSVTTTDSMSMLEEGHAPVRPATPTGNSPGYVRPTHPLAQPPMTPGRRNSTSEYSYYSYMSGSPSRRDRRHHPFRDALTTGGAVFAVRQLFKNRRQRKEDRRAEELRRQRLEEERTSRLHGAQGLTGDGITPPRRVRHTRLGSQSASDVSSFISERPIYPGPTGGAIPVVINPVGGPAAASVLSSRDHIATTANNNTSSILIAPVPHTTDGPIGPPVPPIHTTDVASSGSELYTTTSGRQRHRHHFRDAAVPVTAGTGLAAGAMAAESSRRRHSGVNTDSLESPPVSVKVKMHNDGRHVTLRRLTEEEAAAQREARRRERRAAAATRRRTSSFSSSSGGDALGQGSADRRWQRNEQLERQQEIQSHTVGSMTPTHYPTPPPPGTQAIDPRTGQTYHVPPIPPIPATNSNIAPTGSMTSPGTDDASGTTDYANNRRRRRAERAQARLAREGRNQNTVDFT